MSLTVQDGRGPTQVFGLKPCASQAARRPDLQRDDREQFPRPVSQIRKPSIWFEVARRAALSLPGVEEHATARGPVFRVGRKLLARLDQDGISLLVHVSADEREMLIEAEPKTFSDTGCRRSDLRLRVHLAYVDERSLQRILKQSWRERAPKGLQHWASGS
jgi:hypothetical protein